MNTCTTETPKVAGIHELAREHLTTLCDEFIDGDPVRIVSAWRNAERMAPEDLAGTYEGPYTLRLRVSASNPAKRKGYLKLWLFLFMMRTHTWPHV